MKKYFVKLVQLVAENLPIIKIRSSGLLIENLTNAAVPKRYSSLPVQYLK